MERKLDMVLSLFYDKENLLWRSIPVLNIIVFSKEIFENKLSDNEISYSLSFLLDNGYIKEVERHHVNGIQYSITTKGVQLKHLGGFVWQTRRELLKSSLLYISYFAIIVAGWYYAIEIYKFYWKCICD